MFVSKIKPCLFKHKFRNLKADTLAKIGLSIPVFADTFKFQRMT